MATFAALGVVLGLVFALVAAGPSPRPDFQLTFAVLAALTDGCSLALGRPAVWRLTRLDQDDGLACVPEHP
ncbi:hypothetical protein [Arthrobacter sp. AFG7.2]|uniref:hypothetical protein n=1 Tax=Arthrobacter sp. AFG7.2 TaxID=1688693 RepID=UPI0011AF746A|nr:hypothetical protein [Arthrobacter sp. AFG7.2]